MKKNNNYQTVYFQRITKYIRQLTGYNINLSPKDLEILTKLYEKQISEEIVKKIIKKEFIRFPPEKRKKIRLNFLENYLNKLKPPGENFQKLPDTLKELKKETIKINHIWKTLPEKEKKILMAKALKIIKKEFIINNINKEKVLKSILRKLIKEKYLNN